MDFDAWQSQYRPIKNMIDANAAMDGILFESYGAEVEAAHRIFQLEPGRVWTVTVCDDDVDDGEEDEPGSNAWHINDGWHYVNRLGYIVTEVAFVPSIETPWLCIEYD